MQAFRDFVLLDDIFELAVEAARSSPFLRRLTSAERPKRTESCEAAERNDFLQPVATRGIDSSLYDILASYYVECFLQRRTLRLYYYAADGHVNCLSRSFLEWPEDAASSIDLDVNFRATGRSDLLEAAQKLRELFQTRFSRYQRLHSLRSRDENLPAELPSVYKVFLTSPQFLGSSWPFHKILISECDLPGRMDFLKFEDPAPPQDTNNSISSSYSEISRNLSRGRPRLTDKIVPAICALWPDGRRSCSWKECERMVFQYLEDHDSTVTGFSQNTLKRAWKQAHLDVMPKQ